MKTPEAVVDASPLIYLAAANRLDLLTAVTSQVVVPEQVWLEIRSGGHADAAVAALAKDDWYSVADIAEIPKSVLAWDIGIGESSVLAYALKRTNAIVIMDDWQGRQCARTHRLEVKGTLGLVLLAKREGRIESAQSVIEELRSRGMYLSDHVIDAALKLVGE